MEMVNHPPQVGEVRITRTSSNHIMVFLILKCREDDPEHVLVKKWSDFDNGTVRWVYFPKRSTAYLVK